MLSADFIFQFLCTTLLLSGLWIMGNKKLLGVLFVIIAEIFTTTVGVTHGVWSITVIGICLAIVQTRNFIKWRSENTPWI
jgi:hypothetical protein